MRLEPPLIEATPAVVRIVAEVAGSDPRLGLGLGPVGTGTGARVQHRVVGVSDVHVGAGRSPVTHRIDPLDLFLPAQEQQFLRFLMREWLSASGLEASEAFILGFGDLPWRTTPDILSHFDASHRGTHRRASRHELTLNLNGDIFDFLQTTSETQGVRYPDGLAPGLRAPRCTPANAIAQLNVMRRGHPEFFRALAMHLCLGHRIDLIPGNHDRALFNPHVWSGHIEVAGQTLHGFRGLLEEELRALGLSDDRVRPALERLRRLPFAVYGDVYFEHGDHLDAYNRVRRPWSELLEPTSLHVEMPLALGDHGVRSGVHELMASRPVFAERYHCAEGLLDLIRAPHLAFGMVLGYLKASLREGYDVSSAHDFEQRLDDARALPAASPNLLEAVNAFRGREAQLGPEALTNALVGIEREAATPFFSNFKVRSGLIRRLLQMAAAQVLGREDTPNFQWMRRLERIQKGLGVGTVFHGHTHVADDRLFLTRDGHTIRAINTHTWTNRTGAWSEAARPLWSRDSRGVGVVELRGGESGESGDSGYEGHEGAEERLWSDCSLMKISDATGRLSPGWIFQVNDRPRRSDERRIRALLNSSTSMPSLLGISTGLSQASGASTRSPTTNLLDAQPSALASSSTLRTNEAGPFPNLGHRRGRPIRRGPTDRGRPPRRR